MPAQCRELRACVGSAIVPWFAGSLGTPEVQVKNPSSLFCMTKIEHAPFEYSEDLFIFGRYRWPLLISYTLTWKLLGTWYFIKAELFIWKCISLWSACPFFGWLEYFCIMQCVCKYFIPANRNIQCFLWVRVTCAFVWIPKPLDDNWCIRWSQ